MEYEKLALEVGAAKAGLKPVDPRVLQGRSGVEHRVDLLFSDGTRSYGFDFYESPSEIEVIKTYSKMVDTGTTLNVVCTGAKASEGAAKLASSYKMRILNPEAAETFFVLESLAPKTSDL